MSSLPFKNAPPMTDAASSVAIKRPWGESSNFASNWTIWWAGGLISYAYKHTLKQEDLPPLERTKTAEYLSEKFERLWAVERLKDNPSVARLFVRIIVPFYLQPIFLFAIFVALLLFSPAFLIKNLIAFLADANPNKDYLPGYLMIMGFFLSSTLQALFQHRAFSLCVQCSMRARIMFMSAVYHKALRMGSVSSTIGEIVTLQTNDASRIAEVFRYFHQTYITFWIATVVLVLVSLAVGPIAGVMGVLILLGLYLPFQLGAAKYFQRKRRRIAAITDRRIRLMSEILTAVKLVKLYNWEKSFADKVAEIRDDEISNMRKSSILRMQMGSLALLTAPLALFATFVCYLYLQGSAVLDPVVVYTVSSLYDALRNPIGNLPNAIRSSTEALVAFRRLQTFLLQPELNDQRELHPATSPADPIAVEIDNATFKWPTGHRELEDAIRDSRQARHARKKAKRSVKGGTSAESSLEATPEEKKVKRLPRRSADEAESSREDEPEVKVQLSGEEGVVKASTDLTILEASTSGSEFSLQNINLRIKPGQLVAIVGRVGSGKSALLSAVLGQIPMTTGKVVVRGTMSMVGQQSWILNDTLRENILFGEKWDEKRYTRTILACQLLKDLELLPAGDFTEIGERGINLSGGQKQRVSIARAVYAGRDIYCFDDPLSAVDQHVGNRLFNLCINGVLRGKTRLFVTNQLHYLPQCDRILVLHNGQIIADGTYAELVARNVDFGVPKENDKENNKKENKKKSKKGSKEALSLHEKKGRGKERKKEKKSERRRVSTVKKADSMAAVLNGQIDFSAFAEKAADAKITIVEDRAIGRVKASVYLNFSRAAGSSVYFFLIFLLYCLTQAARVMPDIWLSWWSSRRDIGLPLDLNIYTGIWAALIGSVLLLFIFRNLVFAFWTLEAAKQLHNGVFAKVLRTPMSFFDATPLGRILNRFSKDQDQIDDMIPDYLSQTLHFFAQNASILVLVSILMPWFILAAVPGAAIFIGMAIWFRAASRDLKRMDSIARSPIFAHLSATISGLPTIRAYAAQARFLALNHSKLDRNAETTFYFEMAGRWLAMRLDLVVAVLVTATALCIVFTPGVTPSTAGVALMYAIQMANQFQWLLRVAIDTENAFTAVERLLHYRDNLPTEAPAHIPHTQPDASWPSQGVIEFEDACVSYGPSQPLVLKNLSFRTKPAEKIGIAGRTGAGKSTMTTALFRIMELHSGRIIVDGVDIATIGLYNLRSKLGIIPQDPVLFTGTVRSNLDPFREHEDSAIWACLKKVSLADSIATLRGQLEAEVLENGENFSVGQRQLLCIGRALLRNSKILVLDEATASIDLETDRLIQRTIRESFSSCTVMTIAHRLHTIIDSDRVMVLDRGQLVELDTPDTLLRNPNSAFARLVAETGKGEAAKLKEAAKEKFHIELKLAK